MNDLLKALSKITTWLEEQEIAYMVFGGIANAIYGNPRLTYDIDVKIKIDEDRIDKFVNQIKIIGKALPENIAQFIKDTNVLPLTINDVRIDIVLATLPFEIRAIERSKKVAYQKVAFKVCTIEDFIIQKAVSTREKDWYDISTIIEINRNKLNWDYLMGNCQDLSRFLDNPEIIEKIKQFKNGT